MLFEEFTLTSETQRGLKDSNFINPTPIQLSTLPFTLEGRDIQAQAKTGSGKTISFVIPILERLHSLKWQRDDGLGALIISPTRELALQIFKVFTQIGKHHNFSCGLLIGGKDLKQEQDRVQFMNILVCTPGRFLQHLETSVGFECSNLEILVFDEADRLLDMGFKKDIDAILEGLGKERQTLLFSATLSTGILDLARLSLKNPEIVSVDKDAENCTPKNLIQRYIVTPLPSKLDILFSFIKSHLKTKMIIFLSSCKQVRFVFESFCKMQPGIPLLALHGKQNQQKRMGIYEQFSKKTQACLIATDIAARGLDIPAVDWVIQVDCPDDSETYIHRVGRTARYNKKGQALLFLLPSELEFLKELELKKVPIELIKINPTKQSLVKPQLAALCSQNPDMKYLAQKAFVCYMRSIHLQKNKNVFDVHKLPTEEYAESLGLVGAPNIKFKEKKSKNKSRQLENLDNKPLKLGKSKPKLQSNDDSSEEDPTELIQKKAKTRIEKLFNQRNTSVLSEHYTKLVQHEDNDEDDFLKLTREDHDISGDEQVLKKPGKKATKLKKRLIELGTGNRIVFDDDGEQRPAYELQPVETLTNVDEDQVEFYRRGLKEMKDVDQLDKETEKQRRREEKRERKLKEKALRREESGPAGQVTLKVASDNDDEVMTGSDYDSGKDYDVKSDSDYDREKDDKSDEGSDSESDGVMGLKRKNSGPNKPTKKTKLDYMDQGSLEEMALGLLQ